MDINTAEDTVVDGLEAFGSVMDYLFAAHALDIYNEALGQSTPGNRPVIGNADTEFIEEEKQSVEGEVVGAGYGGEWFVDIGWITGYIGSELDGVDPSKYPEVERWGDDAEDISDFLRLHSYVVLEELSHAFAGFRDEVLVEVYGDAGFEASAEEVAEVEGYEVEEVFEDFIRLEVDEDVWREEGTDSYLKSGYVRALVEAFDADPSDLGLRERRASNDIFKQLAAESIDF